MTSTEALAFVATNTSVNPRLLLALLEYKGHWLTQPDPGAPAVQYPMGLLDPQQPGLFNQIVWAANTLNQGYYGWKTRGLRTLQLRDGKKLAFPRGLNAGTIAVQYYLAQLAPDQASWEQDVGPSGFPATYRNLFGDPFARAIEPLVPPDLQQPQFVLPFASDQMWYFSAGPHGGWGRTTSGWAAMDFSPPYPSNQKPAKPCYVSPFWATAVIGGVIARSWDGAVVVDADGDRDERTGWTVLYLHIATKDRIPVGTTVQPGSNIGHPSCEGFFLNSPGTHLHIARRYNGEWIAADCGVCAPGVHLPPFVLGGWTVKGDHSTASLGWLTRGADTRRLYAGRDALINGVTW